MIFTGTLIQDLMATVERTERLREVSVRSGAIQISSGDLCLLEASLRGGEPSPMNSWFASVDQSLNYDPKLFGVA